MNRFAFIINPTTINQSKDFLPALKILPNFIIKSAFKKNVSFRVSNLRKVQSIHNGTIEGYFVACPLLPMQFLGQGKKLVLAKVIAAAGAIQRLGAGIIGIDKRIQAMLGAEYDSLAKNLKVPVTDGSVLTAWSIFEAIYRTAKFKKINLKGSVLGITGAADPVGNLCAMKLAEYAGRMVITGGEKNKLERLKETISHLSPIEITIEDNVNKAAKAADILINADNPAGAIFDLEIEALKPNMIFCANSLNDNLRDKIMSRRDISFIEAGLIKMPLENTLNINTGLPEGVISASLAETMLLAFEGKFTSYSLGENINPDKLEEIADIAARHGFEVWAPDAPVI